MEQVEEFDSSSSSSSSSGSESSSNESSGGEEEGESSCEAGESDVNDSQEDEGRARGAAALGQRGSTGLAASSGISFRQQKHRREEDGGERTEGGRRRKRLRKRKATGLRKKLRTHIESVDEFNPEARSAQSAELERLRRLQLQQSLTAGNSVEPGTSQHVISPSAYADLVQPSTVDPQAQQIFTSPLVAGAVASSVPLQQMNVASTDQTGTTGLTSRSKSSSPEVLMVDLTYTAKASDRQSRVDDAIVIDSGSDSDTNANQQGHTQTVVAMQQSGEAGVVGPTPHTDPNAVATPTRSGLLKMKYGEIVPSPDGRVLVNAGHDRSDRDIFLAPQIARAVKPHQVGGIRFLYDNIVESLSRFNSSPGFGCILAHSMGLGKTLQVIGFIEVFFRCTSAKHVLCVVPVNTLQNWIGEFEHWVPPPPPNSNKSAQSSGAALLTNQNPLWSQVTGATPTPTTSSAGRQQSNEIHYRTFNIFVLSEANRTMESRLKVIRDWRSTGGVLLLGYEMYRLLSLSVPSLGGNKMAVKKKKNLVVKAPAGGTIDLDETEREMDALIEIQNALCKPGPDLVVCDEGHRIKNDYSNISQALKRISTRRRIVMTGYPLQNNLTEYWCMVDFVRPNLLGTKQEFADLFERPITNGQCVDSTPVDVRLMRYRAHVLHSLLEGFVLRRGHEILKSTLPPKFEHVMYLRPSQVQADLYNYSMSAIEQLARGTASSAGPLKAFAVCSKIWNHPDIYYQEAMAQNSKRISPTAWLDQEGLPKTLLTGAGKSAAAAGGGGESSCKIEWPSASIPSYQPGLLENSPKIMVLIELIDRSVQLGDKILIFSQSLNTLTYIEKLLSRRPIPIPNSTNPTSSVQYSNVKWTKNKNYCRLDGSTNSIERDRLINNFNSASNLECWVFLLSTKAGCLGINLIGANRVVVMDVSWNPCYDSQAVCRVYRYGQTKPCYIYRLVCDGTMERKIYDRQISKQSMSNRVVDELHPERHLTSQDILKLITPLAQLPSPMDYSAHAMDYLFDPLLMQLCSTHGHLFTKLPFKHESLLIDSEEERMTDVEKYLAMKGFQQDLKALRGNPGNNPATQGYRPQPNLGNPQRGQTVQVRAPQVQGGQARSPVTTSQARTPTGQTGLSQQYPQIAGLQVPIPPISEATPSTSGLMRKGTMAAAPVVKETNKTVEVICLDSDDDDDNVALTRGEPSRFGAPANDLVSHLQSQTHLQGTSALSLPVTTTNTVVDPLPTTPGAIVLLSPTATTSPDGSSALNLNMSHNNSISPLFNLIMAVTKDSQQFLAANHLFQEASSGVYLQPAIVTTTSSQLNGSVLLPGTTTSDSNVAVSYASVPSFTQLQNDVTPQVEQENVAMTTSSSSTPLSSSFVDFKSSSMPFFQQQTQVFGSTAPILSLSSSDTMMSSSDSMMSSSVNNQSQLLSPGQILQVSGRSKHQDDLNNSHCPNSLLLTYSLPSDTMQSSQSPCVSPVARSSPSHFTPSPSSPSLSPPSPHHPDTLSKTPQSSITPDPLPTFNVLTPPLSPPSIKLKRTQSHSEPVRHLETSPVKHLRKTQSSSPPKSYFLDQRFNSSLTDDVHGNCARSSSVSPISTLSPSQSNSSDCSSSPERPSKPGDQSPNTRVESSVKFRYSSSPSPSNTSPAPYTPCSIPLLSPVAARLLFLSTGTQLPSSPPEDVDKLPPIIPRKRVPSSDVQKKESSPLLKRESSGSPLLNAAEKKHQLDKKKRRGSSLAKSMELVPMSNDLSTDPFFSSAPTCVTTPTTVSPMPPVTASNSCVTTPSPSDPTPMLCTPLPLRRKSISSSVSSTDTGNAGNLWAPKTQCQPPYNGKSCDSSHDQSHSHRPESLLSSLVKMAASSNGITSLTNNITSSSNMSFSKHISPVSEQRSSPTAQGHTLSSSALNSVSTSNHSHFKATMPVWSATTKICSTIQGTPSTHGLSPSLSTKKVDTSANLKEVLSKSRPQVSTAAHTKSSPLSAPCVSSPPLSSTAPLTASTPLSQLLAQKSSQQTHVSKATELAISSSVQSAARVSPVTTSHCTNEMRPSYSAVVATRPAILHTSTVQNAVENSTAMAHSRVTSPSHLLANSARPTHFVGSMSLTAHCTSPTQFTTSVANFAHSASLTASPTVQSTNRTHSAATNLTSPTRLTSSASHTPSPTHIKTSGTSVPATITSPPAEMTLVSSDSSGLGLLPEGVELRVVSGLLQAGPPMTLNTIHGGSAKQNNSQALMNGNRVVTVGSTRPTATIVSSAHHQRSRKRSSSDSNTVLPPPPVSCSKLVSASSLPDPTSLVSRPLPVNASNPTSLVSRPPPPVSTSKLVNNSTLPSPVSRPSSTSVPGSGPSYLPSVKVNSALQSSAKSGATVKQQPSLTSRRKYSLNLSSLTDCIPHEGVAAGNGSSMNMTNGVSSDSSVGLITSPSDLLSPPGSSTLPDLLKAFTFPVSLSPPMERRQMLTLAQTVSPGEQHSLKSHDSQRKDQVQSNQQRCAGFPPSSLVVPNSQINNNPALQTCDRKKGDDLSPSLQKGNDYLLSQKVIPTRVPPKQQQQHRVSPVAVPISQRNGRRLSPDVHKNSLHFLVQGQPNNAKPPSKHKKTNKVLSPTSKRSSHLLSPSGTEKKSVLSSSRIGNGAPQSFHSHKSNGDKPQRNGALPSSTGNEINSSLLFLDGRQSSNAGVTYSSCQKSSPLLSPTSQCSFAMPRSSSYAASDSSVPSSTVPSSSIHVDRTPMSSNSAPSSTVLSLNGLSNSTLLPSSTPANGTVLSLNGLSNDTLLSLKGLSNGTLLAPNGLSNGTLLSPNGLSNGTLLSPNGLSNGTLLSPNGLSNGTLLSPNGSPNGNNGTLSSNGHDMLLPNNGHSSCTLLSPTSASSNVGLPINPGNSNVHSANPSHSTIHSANNGHVINNSLLSNSHCINSGCHNNNIQATSNKSGQFHNCHSNSNVQTTNNAHGNGTIISRNSGMLSPSSLGHRPNLPPSVSNTAPPHNAERNSSIIPLTSQPDLLRGNQLLSPNAQVSFTLPFSSQQRAHTASSPSTSLNGLVNGSVLSHDSHMTGSVISHTSQTSSPRLSHDLMTTSPTFTLDQERWNPLVSPNSQNGFSWPTQQSGSMVPNSTSAGSNAGLPKDGHIGSALLLSGYQRNTTHNSPGSNSQLSHDLQRNGNVSTAGSQRSRSLSSSSQYPPNTAISPPALQIGSSTMPLSGHQRSSTVRTPTSEKNVVHPPTRKKSTSSSKKQKNSPVVVPTSVRNGHDPRVLVPIDHKRSNTVVSSSNCQRRSSLPQTNHNSLNAHVKKGVPLSSSEHKNAHVLTPDHHGNSARPSTSWQQTSALISSNSQSVLAHSNQLNNQHLSSDYQTGSGVTTSHSVRRNSTVISPSSQRNSHLISTTSQIDSHVISLPSQMNSHVISPTSQINRRVISTPAASQINSRVISDDLGHSVNIVPPSSQQRDRPFHLPQLPSYQTAIGRSGHSTTTTIPDRHGTTPTAPGQHGSAPSQHRTTPTNYSTHETMPSAPGQHRTTPTNFSGHRTTTSAPGDCRTTPTVSSGHRTTPSAPGRQKTTPTAVVAPQQKYSSPVRSSPAPVAVGNVACTKSPLMSTNRSQCQSDNPPLQRPNLPSVSTLWDSASLSLLSDLFAPQPSSRQRHHSDSSLLKSPSSVVTPPTVGGDWTGNPQPSCQQQFPQTPLNLPRIGGDSDTLTNGLSSISQVLSSVSQCNSQRSSSIFPQTVQRSTPTRPHPLLQQQVSGPCTQRSLPQQQSDPSLISSSMSRPLSHQVRPASNVNDSGLTHQNFPSVHESRSSEVSSVAACSYQHVQKSLPCQQGGATSLPSLPKLTPLPSSQPPRQSSSHQPFVQTQAPNIPTPHCQLPVSSSCIDMSSSVSYTSAQVPKCAESAVPSSPVIPTVSDNSAPQSNTEGSALTSDLSLNLLSSILNSLTPSQLESLLSTSESQIPPQAVLYGNGRQGNLQSCMDIQPAASYSQITPTSFQNSNQNFESSISASRSRPLSLPLSHSIATHPTTAHALNQQQRSKVIPHGNHTSHGQFRVHSSCSRTTTGLTGQLLHLESTASAAACGGTGAPGARGSTMLDGSDAMATNGVLGNSMSILQLHSGQ